jgi:hypothetical protein
MNLSGLSGLQLVITPKELFEFGGYRHIDVLAGFLDDKSAYWRAESDEYILYLNYYTYTLTASMAETDNEAKQDGKVIGAFKKWEGLLRPTTKEVIDLMKWKIKDDQIIEFSNY